MTYRDDERRVTRTGSLPSAMALDDFTHESLQDAGSIADYLLALNDGFKKGQLTLEEGEEALILEPRGPLDMTCLLYTSPSPRDGLLSRMPSSA